MTIRQAGHELVLIYEEHPSFVIYGTDAGETRLILYVRGPLPGAVESHGGYPVELVPIESVRHG